MTVEATYQLQVDWGNDGSFSTAGDDITADVLEVSIDRGFYAPLGRVAAVGRMRVLLNNDDRQYSPELDSSILPRRPVLFRMTYDSITVTLFRGFLESMQPAGGQFGRRGDPSRYAVMQCVDAMAVLDTHEAQIAIQQGVYADDIIDAVVSDIYTPPSTNYQNGINLFPTSGERWSLEFINYAFARQGAETVTGTQKVMDACTSDWGRFFIAKNGAPTFYNRHQTPLDDTADLTLNDTMADLIYRKGEDEIFNHVEVTCHPRVVGERNEVLARIPPDRAERIEASVSRTFILHYRDPSNRAVKIGGLSVVTPVADTDYEVTSDEAGEGDDETGNVTATMSAFADRAEVTLTNGVARAVWVQRLEVRGIAVRTREPETAVKTDSASIAAYGRRKLPVDAVLMNTMPDADRLAEYLLDVNKDPQARVEGVAIEGNHSATLIAAVRDLELLDRVDVTETQTGLSAFEGFIYRMRHRITRQQGHQLTVDLETAYDIQGTEFRLDTSSLDSGHVLIY